MTRRSYILYSPNGPASPRGNRRMLSILRERSAGIGFPARGGIPNYRLFDVHRELIERLPSPRLGPNQITCRIG